MNRIITIFIVVFFPFLVLAQDVPNVEPDNPENIQIEDVAIPPAQHQHVIQHVKPKTTLFYICKEKSLLKVVRPKVEDVFTNLPAYFDWEGGASSFSGTFTPDEMVLYWKLDIRGPYWLYVTYIQNIHEVSIEVEHSNGEWSDCRHADSFDELVKDGKDEMTNLMRAVLERIGQKHCPRDVESIKAFNYKMYIPSKKDIVECMSIINQLNDDEWRVRDKATTKLTHMPYVGTFEFMLSNYNLSPEQECRIASIRAYLNLEIMPEVQLSLENEIGLKK